MHTEQHHTHHHGAESAEELLALVRYMASHNASHTEELASLAAQVDENSAACNHLTEAIALYRNGNAQLTRALEALENEV